VAAPSIAGRHGEAKWRIGKKCGALGGARVGKYGRARQRGIGPPVPLMMLADWVEGTGARRRRQGLPSNTTRQVEQLDTLRPGQFIRKRGMGKGFKGVMW
jgi:hypothetical protein